MESLLRLVQTLESASRENVQTIGTLGCIPMHKLTVFEMGILKTLATENNNLKRIIVKQREIIHKLVRATISYPFEKHAPNALSKMLSDSCGCLDRCIEQTGEMLEMLGDVR